MSKYIFQLRRGTRYVDGAGNTLLNEDGTPMRDDWATYTNQEDHLDPQEGELVLEYEVNPETGKKTPRLKIGDGISIFAALDYISVDSFILPKQPTTITLFGGDAWTSVSNKRYEQDVTEQLIGLVTPNSKIDLQPTPEQLNVLAKDRVALTTVNEDCQVKVYAVGDKPQHNYENIPITITEVICNG